MLSNITQLNNLLQIIDVVAAKHNEKKEWKKNNGEFFNVFDIIHAGHYEAKTHSPFLAELLRPGGSHGCGDKFLRAFLEIFSTSTGQTVDFENIDKTNIDEEAPTDDGRMDIVFNINRCQFIIENKIYANDQYQQISRYYNKATKDRDNGKIDNFYIIYLTLNGDAASESSTGNLAVNKDYFVLSYKHDITSWIEKCILIASQKPTVRETLVQYKNLINEITGNDDIDEEDRKELYEILLKNPDAAVEMFDVISNPDDAYEAFDVILKHSEAKNIDYESFVLYAFKKYVEPEFKKFSDINSFEHSANIGNNGRLGSFSFRKRSWNHSIGIQNDKRKGNGYRFYIGICSDRESNEWFEKLDIFTDQPNSWWPYGNAYLDNEVYSYFCPSVINSFISGEYATYIENWVVRILEEVERKNIKL